MNETTKYVPPPIDQPVEGRVAQCSDCSRERPSTDWPPMFASWAEGSLRGERFGVRDKDTFYCGCRGWD